MGDKTQLLSLILVLRYKQPWAIMGAIFVATLANHLGATWFGALLAGQVPEVTLKYILGALFIIFGLWILKPDSDDGLDQQYKHGAFWTTLVVFFLADASFSDSDLSFWTAFAYIFGSLLSTVKIPRYSLPDRQNEHTKNEKKNAGGITDIGHWNNLNKTFAAKDAYTIG